MSSVHSPYRYVPTNADRIDRQIVANYGTTPESLAKHLECLLSKIENIFIHNGVSQGILGDIEFTMASYKTNRCASCEEVFTQEPRIKLWNVITQTGLIVTALGRHTLNVHASLGDPGLDSGDRMRPHEICSVFGFKHQAHPQPER